MTIDAPLDAPAVGAPLNSLVTSPILPTLLRLALPNTVAMFGSTLVAVAETSYIGRLGIEPLAAIALVFPFAMLTQMMSAGAMGGGVSSAVSRALGAGDHDRAASLALHAAIIGVGGGLFFTVMMLLFGRQYFAAPATCDCLRPSWSPRRWFRSSSAGRSALAFSACRNSECAALPRASSRRSRWAPDFCCGISPAAAAG